MEPGDFVEPEIAVTAAVTATLFSPRARKLIRKGLVYGMAGVLTAGDTLATFAKSVGQGMQQASASMAREEQQRQQARTSMAGEGQGMTSTGAPMTNEGLRNREVEATQ